jgi:hypothetical protein
MKVLDLNGYTRYNDKELETMTQQQKATIFSGDTATKGNDFQRSSRLVLFKRFEQRTQ